MPARTAFGRVPGDDRTSDGVIGRRHGELPELLGKRHGAQEIINPTHRRSIKGFAAQGIAPTSACFCHSVLGNAKVAR